MSKKSENKNSKKIDLKKDELIEEKELVNEPIVNKTPEEPKKEPIVDKTPEEPKKEPIVDKTPEEPKKEEKVSQPTRKLTTKEYRFYRNTGKLPN